jgi:tetratricopeptide (TPR) repeat protein
MRVPLERGLPLLLVAAGALAYANSLEGPFIYDDLPSIAENSHIRALWPPRWALPTQAEHAPVNSRPVVGLSLALNYALHGLEVSGYHLFNVAIHLLCGLVLYGVVRRTLGGERLRHHWGAAAPGLAMALALLWLVHPLQSQCVNYLIQRGESLASLFYLLALYGAVRAGHGERPRWYVASVAACGLAMASKEVAATAPLAIVLYEWAYADYSLSELWPRQKAYYAALGATWVLLALLLWRAPHGPSIGLQEQVTPWNYALNQCWAILHYLRLILWPHPLILDYGSPLPLSFGQMLPQILLLLALLAAVAWALYRWPPLGFPALWFFLLLAPTSSFVPIVGEVAAERRVYLALAGPMALLVLAACTFLRRALGNPWAGRLGLGLLIAGALGLGQQTWARNRDYRSGVAIWRTVVEHRPNNPRGHNNLGYSLEQEGRKEEAALHYGRALELKADFPDAANNLGTILRSQGKLDEAIGYYRQALASWPDFPEAHFNLGLVHQARGQPDSAMAHYRQALKGRPGMASAHLNLGVALRSLGRVEEAIHHYQQALKSRPDYAQAHENLGDVLRLQGTWQEALFHYRRAVELSPEDAQNHFKLGNLLSSAGQDRQAAHHYRRAVELEPEYADAYNNLGVVLQSLGEWDQAIECYRRVLELRPGFARAYFNLGLALEGAEQPEEAREHYHKALDLEPVLVEAHNNLGLLYEQMGRLEKAIEHYQQALEVRPDYAAARNNLHAALERRPPRAEVSASR